jgi:hypothetical protein
MLADLHTTLYYIIYLPTLYITDYPSAVVHLATDWNEFFKNYPEVSEPSSADSNVEEKQQFGMQPNYYGMFFMNPTKKLLGKLK